MRLKTRIDKIKNDLAESAGTVVRFAEPNGNYPEAEEDRKHKRKVIVITGQLNGKGVSREEVDQWAR